MSKHTPGPWKWEIVPKYKDVRLVAEHSGRLVVMDFVRWGMQGAQPRFRDERNIMNEFSEIRRHPDARLIAAAPALLSACEAYVAAESLKDPGAYLIAIKALDKQMRAALAQARGGESQDES